MSYLIFRERYDIGKLFAPSYFIKERFVTDVFTRVTVQPPLLSRRIDFCPNMVYSYGARGRKGK